MILIITGNGKGKTTSAIGQAIRAAGWGKKTAIVFFDKGGQHYGEQYLLDKIDEIDIHRFGLQRFDETTQKFRFENTDDDLEEAEKAIQKLLNLYREDYFLIVADEIINAMNLELLPEERVKEVLAQKPEQTRLMLTGRNVPDWLAEEADLISEVQAVKHYFDTGKLAEKGIEY